MPTKNGRRRPSFSADLDSESEAEAEAEAEAESQHHFREDVAMVRDEIQLAIPGRRPSGEDVLNARHHRDERIATMDRQTSPTLGAVLKAARRRIGVTQSQLADLSTVSVRTIRDLELDLTHNPRRKPSGSVGIAGAALLGAAIAIPVVVRGRRTPAGSVQAAMAETGQFPYASAGFTQPPRPPQSAPSAPGSNGPSDRGPGSV